ncbi:ricin-type beta-trefoil lectin domain protein [Nonomuraea sp. NPDC049152]|uniref:ricin-type beta-trefoil lectin domain protein n=1 Tax=Nonomuraea sp. NPDC049152 TaxID=3154350 RepID=UPI0033D5BC1E
MAHLPPAKYLCRLPAIPESLASGCHSEAEGHRIRLPPIFPTTLTSTTKGGAMRWKSSLLRVVVAVAALLSVTGPISSAQAAVISPKAIYSVASGRCLDVSSYANGTPIILWDCHGRDSQQFRRVTDGTIRSIAGNRCLDVSSYAAGTPVVLWDCHGRASQRWEWWDGVLRSTTGARCLDVRSYAAGTQLILADCLGQPSQQFSWNFRHVAGDKCWDVSSYADYTPVILWDCAGQPSQRFRWDLGGAIRNVASGKCLGDDGHLFLISCNFASEFRYFSRETVSSSGACVDVSSYANGTPVISVPCTGGPSQRINW